MRVLGGIVVAASLFAAAANAQAPAGDARRGEAVFMKVGCYTCHGTAGQGGERGSGPRIAPGPLPYEAFSAMVRRPRVSMPRYAAEQLPEAGLADIHAYLAAIPQGRKASEIPLLAQ